MKELGYVYFIKNEQNHIKIGFSKDPEKRIKQLETGNSHNLSLLATIEKSDISFEHHCQSLVEKFRINREWFTYQAWLFFKSCPPFNPILKEVDVSKNSNVKKRKKRKKC